MRLAVLCLLAGCDLAVGIDELPAPSCANDTRPIALTQATWTALTDLETSVDVPLNAPGIACDLDVVFVGWGHAFGGIAEVSDDVGSAYTQVSQDSYQAVYYAAGIAAGANTIHVRFNGDTDAPDVRVLEFTGIDAVHPVDGATQASGAGPTMGTAGLATKHGYDLLVGGTSVSGVTEQLDPSYRPDAHTMPNGNVAADKVVTTSDAYTFSGVQTGDLTFWTVNLVAFRGALSAPP
jgi:hypothetical protein